MLGFCTDFFNDNLYLGDTIGNIKVWDISGYCRYVEERVIFIVLFLKKLFKI